MWVALDGEVPMGYIAGHLSRRFACEGELQWIYVGADYRRTGVASRLLHVLATWFVAHRAARICVNVGDERAWPFYAHHGAVVLQKHWMVWADISHVLKGSSRGDLPTSTPLGAG